MSMFMVNMMDERRYPYVVDYEDDDSDLSINSCDILELTPSDQGCIKESRFICESVSTVSNEHEKNSWSGDVSVSDNGEDDPFGVNRVHENVFHLLKRWGRVLPIPPDLFLVKLVQSRGYTLDYKLFSDTGTEKRTPSSKQLQDYDKNLVGAVRTSNLKKLQSLHAQGQSMSARNKYSESIFHTACRRSEFEIVEFIFSHGGDSTVVDDYGRTVLHDACWRVEPRFDIATLLLDHRLDLLFQLDVRGCPPLQYVKQDNWIHWCAYLFHQKDRYWPAMASSRSSSLAKRKRRSDGAAPATH